MRVYLRKGKGEQRIAKIFTGTCASSLRNKHTYTTDCSMFEILRVLPAPHALFYCITIVTSIDYRLVRERTILNPPHTHKLDAYSSSYNTRIVALPHNTHIVTLFSLISLALFHYRARPRARSHLLHHERWHLRCRRLRAVSMPSRPPTTIQYCTYNYIYS